MKDIKDKIHYFELKKNGRKFTFKTSFATFISVIFTSSVINN